jgi:hydroxymethylglutaryl-CoA reductase
MEIRKGPQVLPGLFQLDVKFLTAEAMGANFINSVLEALAGEFSMLVKESGMVGELEIIMSILSNYTPESLVKCTVEGDVSIFDRIHPDLSGDQFARKFILAVDIAHNDIYRAVTHNKGIFNGMDAVIMATGNDYRAVEACGHAFASRTGRYESLSTAEVEERIFRFSLEVPMALGTVGGLTSTHPLAAAALEILGNPSAEQLMQIVAAAGLANNFSAVRSLITTGIQKGHMKMHLGNILRQLHATEREVELTSSHFSDRPVSHAEVSDFLEKLRVQQSEDG